MLIDLNFIKTTLNGIRTWVNKRLSEEIHTPDYEADDGQDGYIKNRPCYVGAGEVEILPETTVEIDPDNPVGAITTELNLVEGKTYTVFLNGTEYSCVAQPYAESDFDEEGNPVTVQVGVLIGDIGFLETGEPVSGEPFVVVDLNAAFAVENGAPALLFALDGSESVTLSIRGEGEVVHKLDTKFLPEGVPYVEPFNDVIIGAWPKSFVDSYNFTDPAGYLVDGSIYKVNWGGTIYECAARRVEVEEYGEAHVLGDGLYFDGVITGDPFCIVISSKKGRMATGVTGMMLVDAPPENGEFSITGYKKVQKLDEHCLPENLPIGVVLTYDGDYRYHANGVTYNEIVKALTASPSKSVYLSYGNGYVVRHYHYNCKNSTSLFFVNVDTGSVKSGIAFRTIEWANDDTLTETFKDVQCL